MTRQQVEQEIVHVQQQQAVFAKQATDASNAYQQSIGALAVLQQLLTTLPAETPREFPRAVNADSLGDAAPV